MKKREFIKKVVAMLMVTMMLVSLSACGEKKNHGRSN